jgi:hydrogenase nickel incorporation protein HypA/HybF
MLGDKDIFILNRKADLELMHEGAVIQEVVATILTSAEQAGASHVTHVQLELGVSGHFTEEAVRQYFQALTRNTSIEGATLELSWLPATYQCLSCQRRFESASSTAMCPHCGDVAWEITHQDACSIRSIDLAFPEEP